MDDYDAKHLWDAQRAGQLILDFTKDRNEDDYENDVLLRSAVERQFEIVGEALRRLRDRDNQELVEKLAGASQAIGLRNRIAHEYDSIKNPAVWEIITKFLPDLLADLEHHLSKFDS